MNRKLKIGMLASVWLFTVLLLLSGIAYYHKATTGEVHQVYFKAQMNSETLAPVIKTLNEAEFGDRVEIYVNSPGGVIVDMMTLLYSIKNSKADVKYIVPYYAFSAAASIMCRLDPSQIVVNPSSMILFHEARIELVPGEVMPLRKLDTEEPSILIAIEADKVQFRHCAKFLTQEQIDAYNNSEDVYITGEQFNEQLKKSNDYYRSEWE